MSQTELKRFMSDHAKPGDLAALMARVGPDADAATVAAAMNAEGYSVTAQDLAAAIPEARQVVAATEQAMVQMSGNPPGSADQQALMSQMNAATRQVRDRLNALASQGAAASINEVLEVQMQVNYLSQLAEMSSSVSAASKVAISSIGRNLG